MEFNSVMFLPTISLLIFFSIVYARIVRQMANKNIKGKTAYMVVGGVAFTLVASIPTVGWFPILILICYFAASGLPMVVEYYLRHKSSKRAR